jgi:thiol-disulfide isomerase/thioredoxin
MSSSSQPSKIESLRPLILAGLFMVCGILVLVYLGRDTARLMNGPLGDIDLKPLLNTQEPITLPSLQGKVTVLHFWGTWCPPCVAEYPEFAKLYAKFEANSKIKIVSVSCSPGSESDLEQLEFKTKNYLETIHVSMPVYCDPVMFTRGSVTRMLAAGGFGYPFTLVVDQEGIVRNYWLGADKTVLPQVEKLVKKLAETDSSRTR